MGFGMGYETQWGLGSNGVIGLQKIGFLDFKSRIGTPGVGGSF